MRKNDFIDLLLDHGAEYYSSPRESSWMLSHAAQCGSVRLFKIVLKREKELLSNESFKMQIMDTAIQGGSVEIVNLLLSKNIPFNRDANMYGWTPAHYAARNGQADMIRFLQENDFNLDQRTLSGKSVYNIAHEYDQVDVMRAIKQMKGDTGPARFPELSGAYLGQTPPRGNLRLFAPDIVSGAIGDDNHGSISFMPEGNEVYWNMWLNGKGKIWMTKLQNDQWIKPEIASFSDEGSATDDNPFITPDGRKLFFTSTRSGSVSEGKENIWFVERTSSGWSDPKPVSDEVNAMQLHWSVSVSNSGTLYFGGSGADSYGGTDIYYSRLKEGVYTRPENIGSVINSEGTDHCPYIAPDESYIIFSRFGTGAGFYISYKNPSGKWLEPAKVHARLEGVCPCISPDGRYFFFNMDGIYWMPAGFIERLKPVTGPYLGQEPPGMVPKPFIPGLLNNEKTGAFCSVYSPALDEFYFTRWHREDGTPSGIAWMRMVDGEWSRPEMLGFNSSDSENDMCLSKDGNTMIFRSWRPLPDGTRPDNHSYLWYVTRTESGWSDALPLLCGNEPVRTGYPSASRNNTLYFSHRRDGLLGVYRSELVNGEYQTPEHVTTLFSQNYIHGDLFVAPDESYLIVSGRDPEGKIGFGKNLDLNILYKKVDGSWSRPINMGKDINTIAGGENCPQVSPDGKYLFFNRYNPELKKGNTHWISSHIIERYKHK
jgi:Tol biopolymer transport system component